MYILTVPIQIVSLSFIDKDNVLVNTIDQNKTLLIVFRTKCAVHSIRGMTKIATCIARSKRFD